MVSGVAGAHDHHVRPARPELCKRLDDEAVPLVHEPCQRARVDGPALGVAGTVRSDSWMGSRCGSRYTAADDVFTKRGARFAVRSTSRSRKVVSRLSPKSNAGSSTDGGMYVRGEVEDDVVVDDKGGLAQERVQRTIVKANPRHDATEVVEAPAREVVDHGDPCTFGHEVLHDV